MIAPVGPLPAAVYWRRRVAALVGVVILLLALIWLAAGRAEETQVPPTAQQLPTTTAAPTTTETSTTTSQTSTSSSSVTTTTSVTSTAAAAAQPASAPPPGPPPPCPDQATRVVAEPEQPQYQVGTRPVFRLSVTNTGTVPCVRDLDASLQELLVFAADGTTRLWSSNDCYPGDSNDVRTLQPGESAMFTVTWAGRSSSPGCTGQRVAVPAGDYVVVGKLGPLTSQPSPFRLVN